MSIKSRVVVLEPLVVRHIAGPSPVVQSDYQTRFVPIAAYTRRGLDVLRGLFRLTNNDHGTETG